MWPAPLERRWTKSKAGIHESIWLHIFDSFTLRSGQKERSDCNHLTERFIWMKMLHENMLKGRCWSDGVWKRRMVVIRSLKIKMDSGIVEKSNISLEFSVYNGGINTSLIQVNLLVQSSTFPPSCLLSFFLSFLRPCVSHLLCCCQSPPWPISKCLLAAGTWASPHN